MHKGDNANARPPSADRFGTPEGTPLLALHGFTGGGEDFHLLANRCGPGIDWLAPNLPGHERTAARDGQQMEGNATAALTGKTPDAVSTELQHLARDTGWGPYFLLGYSLGGRVALQLALRDGPSLRGLILIGATPGIADATERTARRKADDALATEIETSGAPAFLEKWQIHPLIASQAATPETWRSQMRQRRFALTASGLAASLRTLGQGAMPPVWDRLPEISCPVLLMTGKNDPKFTAIAASMQTRLPNATHVTIPGAGHAPHLEAPDATADAVSKMLGRS